MMLARKLRISTCLSFCGITRNTFCLYGEKNIWFETVENLWSCRRNHKYKTWCLFLPIKGKILQVSRNRCSTDENQECPHFIEHLSCSFCASFLGCFYNLFCPAFYQSYVKTTDWSTDNLFLWPCFICILFIVCVSFYTCENNWKSHRGLAKECCYLSWINSWYEKVNLIYFVIFCFILI